MKTSEKLYNLNAMISLRFIGLKQIPSYDDMCLINEKIAEVIKEIRELEAKDLERF